MSLRLSMQNADRRFCFVMTRVSFVRRSSITKWAARISQEQFDLESPNFIWLSTLTWSTARPDIRHQILPVEEPHLENRQKMPFPTASVIAMVQVKLNENLSQRSLEFMVIGSSSLSWMPYHSVSDRLSDHISIAIFLNLTVDNGQSIHRHFLPERFAYRDLGGHQAALDSTARSARGSPCIISRLCQGIPLSNRI